MSASWHPALRANSEEPVASIPPLESSKTISNEAGIPERDDNSAGDARPQSSPEGNPEIHHEDYGECDREQDTAIASAPDDIARSLFAEEDGGWDAEIEFSVPPNDPVPTLDPVEELTLPDMKTPETEGKDLASLWQAALDDDDLLADGEDQPQTTDLFPDDGEGFLDDEIGGNQEGDTTLDWAAPAVSNSTQANPTALPDLVGTYSAVVPSAQPANSTTSQPANSTTSQPADLNGYGRHIPTQPQPWSNVPSESQRPAPTKTQSFADKAKGGYSSPYDLPIDVVKPRKRASMQQMAKGYAGQAKPTPVAPPRSTSMYTPLAPPVLEPAPPLPVQAGANLNAYRPQSSQSALPPATQPVLSQTVAAPTLKAKQSSSSFFEDLPVSAKPRPLNAPTRYAPTPNNAQVPPGPNLPAANRPFTPPETVAPPPARPISQSPVLSAAQQLQAPERVSPYAAPPRPLSAFAPPPTAAATSRYSPAPPAVQSTQQTRPKYSAPPTHTQTPPITRPHQPRTSSPLAQPERSVKGPYQSQDVEPEGTAHHSHVSSSSDAYKETDHPANIHGGLVNFNHQQTPPLEAVRQSRPTSQGKYAPAPTSSLSGQGTPPLAAPPKRGSAGHGSHAMAGVASETSFMPPRRSLTQSPSKAFGGARLPSTSEEPYQRPASAHAPTSPLRASNNYETMFSGPQIGRSRGFSQNLDYIVPTDGRESDPLARWKGCPIFRWGFGGTVVTTFPKVVQRYSSGQTAPMLKCSPGEVKVGHIKAHLPLSEELKSFPGPLRSKGKKKDLLSWMSGRIERLEADNGAPRPGSSPSPDDQRRQESAMLWKILRIFVEKDGVLEGSSDVEKAVRDVLTPPSSLDTINGQASFIEGAALAGAPEPSLSLASAIASPAAILDDMRSLLLQGEREKAVWLAVDKRQWAHAMLVSSTVSPDVWKQVIQEFVRQEVRSAGASSQSLAALYEVFAGNWEESIDELVPPSARAGLQFVSKGAESASSKNVLDGLDRWRETLSLILGNRSGDDSRALLSLGRLLLGYDRVEAAHICYIFARSCSTFGGADDAQTSMALIGANHARYPDGSARNEDALLLSEIYEFALSLPATVSASAAAAGSPHLQSYKYHHALMLAEHGLRNEAQQYCDAIFNTIKSSTRPSPYYHAGLITCLDDLTKRLHNSPKDGSSSWISKPSMEKVSGSIFAKFSSFVAGEEDDVASTGSGRDGGAEVGPFAKIAGGTPIISRSPSHADIYGSYVGSDQYNSTVSLLPDSSPANASRYSPAGPYQPRTSQEQYRPLPNGRSVPLEHGATPEIGVSSLNATRPHAGLSLPTHPGPGSQAPSYGVPESAYSGSTTLAGHSGYPSHTPSPPMTSAYGHNPAYAAGPNPALSYNPGGSTFDPPSSSGCEPPSSGGYEPPSSGGYEPPSSGGYEPPSDTYKDDGSPTGYGEENTRKPMMDNGDDDEDDGAARAKTKAEKDAAADEAFRRAAEEDAKKDQKGEKKAWFGGWFGKKSADQGQGQGLNKPIRAKLGEESSFYYDPELKKWVNKKGGSTPTAASATPPPPKGPSLRTNTTSSGASGTPPSSSAPPPRTGPSLAPSSTAQTLNPTTTISGLPPSGPPSELSTPARDGSPALAPSLQQQQQSSSLSLPSSSSQRAGTNADETTLAPAPPSRPPTSMSTASSIDDLLGPPGAGQARKGGTVKKGKKGRGYVDVMAK
ncbi:MAG: hypothetical protein M1825_003708 [Sarcosagium campestre]|nr:MAG: hypothetical protein M1825_003708 [Sarcosagium campestre]